MMLLIRRLLFIAVLGLLAVGAAVPAEAQPVGTLTFSPATGLDSMSLTVVSSNVCPAGPASNVQLRVSGAGFPTGTNVTPNLSSSAYPVDPDTGGYDVPLQDSLRDFAAQQSPPATLSGRYDFSLVCRGALGKAVYATYAGALVFSSPTRYSAVAASTGAVAPPTSTPSATSRAAGSRTPSPAVTVVASPARSLGTSTAVPATARTPGESLAAPAATTSRRSPVETARPTPPSRSASPSSRPALAVPQRPGAAATPSATAIKHSASPSSLQIAPRPSAVAVGVRNRSGSSASAGPLGLAGLVLAVGVAGSLGLLLRRRRPPVLPPGPTP